MDFKLLSLDTSTSSSGWALFVNGKYKDSGVIDLKKVKNTSERLKTMIIKLRALIDYCSPTVVAIETPVVCRNPLTQRMLSMIFGIVYGKCAEDGIEFYELRPTEWRKLIDSNKKPRRREELKEWSKLKVKELFGIKDVSDDVSDAILIGQAYVNMFNGGGD